MTVRTAFVSLLIGLAAVASAPARAQDVGVSISIGQPGFYGRIDIGDYPRPRIIYSDPVIIDRRAFIDEPYYVRVPPGHRKNWKRYCRDYGACGRPVYFVDNAWYQYTYVPEYRRRHDHRDDRDRRGHDHGHGRGKGNGRGNGNGHGKGHRD